jgi:uncharacterized protein DUF6589
MQSSAPNLNWNFQYEEFADLAPRPTRQLQKTDVGDDQACPLQTMEAEEMSNEGTKSWLIHLARSQLALGDNTLAKVLVMVYGDLGTVKVIHSTQSHMTEERHDSDRLRWAWPVFGLFHLRKRLLELIIKEFRGKGSKDFAHLDAMITKVNMKGFRDDKCEHFRQAEDLVQLGYRSTVSAAIMDLLPPPPSDVTITERRDYAAMEMMKMGKEETRSHVVEYVYRHLFEPAAAQPTETEGPEPSQRNELLAQACQLARIIGLYLELKDTIRFGRVGKLPALLRLLLPWFAGSKNASNYTRELMATLLQQQFMDPNTWDSMLDNMLRPARLGGWVEADMACEHLVRVLKDNYKARGGSFTWEKLMKHTSLISDILYNAKLAFTFAHLTSTDIKLRGKHYDKSQMLDILSVAEELLRADTLKSSAVQGENNSANNLWEIGCQKIPTHDPLAIRDYLFGRDYGKGGREVDLEEGLIQDMSGAFEHDPDIIYEENELDEQQGSVHIEEPLEVAQLLERARRDLEGVTGRTMS